MNYVDFFGHKVSKLIIGDNPLTGHSYITDKYSGEEMKSFYTAEKIKETFRHIEELGCNTMLPLADPYIIRLMQEYQEEGGNIQCIWQPYAPMDQQVSMREIKKLNTIGIYHQGTKTDFLKEKGDFEQIKENIKMYRELGVPVGLGTHYPDMIEKCEEENWDVDFYVACLHNARRGRVGEPSGFLTGKSKANLSFYAADRPIMLNTLKNVKKPVIAFKIFAGGQMFFDVAEETKGSIIKGVYEEVFTALKPNDIAAMGVFQKYNDELKQNIDIYNEWYNEKKNV